MKHFSKLVWSITAAFALIVAMGAVSPAAAQGKQLGVGYQFVNSSASGSSSSQPLGWFADLSFPLGNPMLGIVVSVDGSYKSETIGTIDVSSKTHAFMGGVKYSLPASGMITPFVQFMGGAAVLSSSVAGTSASETKGAFDIGGGVNFEVSPKLLLRVGVDYRRIMSDPGLNQIRILAGVALPIGG